MLILTLCTGNTCRSPMAEGIFDELIKRNNLNIEVKSAGTFAVNGERASKNSILALDEIDIDISKHKSSLLDVELINKADLILAMSSSHKQAVISRCPKAKNKVFLLNEYAFGINKDITDPFGGDLGEYKSIRNEIFKAVEEIIKKLVNNE